MNSGERVSLLKETSSLVALCSEERANDYKVKLRDNTLFPRCTDCNVPCFCLKFRVKHSGFMGLLCCKCLQVADHESIPSLEMKPPVICSHWIEERDVKHVLDTAEDVLYLMTTPSWRKFRLMEETAAEPSETTEETLLEADNIGLDESP